MGKITGCFDVMRPKIFVGGPANLPPTIPQLQQRRLLGNAIDTS